MEKRPVATARLFLPNMGTIRGYDREINAIAAAYQTYTRATGESFVVHCASTTGLAVHVVIPPGYPMVKFTVNDDLSVLNAEFLQDEVQPLVDQACKTGFFAARALIFIPVDFPDIAEV